MKTTIRYILSVTLIISFVFILTISFDRHICNDISELISYSSEIEEYIHLNDNENAFKTYEQLNNRWSKIKNKWSFMINHILIKDVDLSITCFGHYIKNTLTDDALVERQKLLRLLNAVKCSDRLVPSNIF